jgi:hypothetical protein
LNVINFGGFTNRPVLLLDATSLSGLANGSQINSWTNTGTAGDTVLPK